MTVHLPIDGELECDDCGDMVDISLSEYSGDPPSVGMDECDMPEGWTEEDGRHLCPKCSN